jgi:hypothetical protein
MIKIIQTIVLTAVVFSPLSLISLVTSATAHHTSSHVSNVAVATTQTRKKGVKKAKKPATTGNSQKKPATDATTQPPEGMPSSESMPVKPTKPDTSSSDKMKPSGVIAPKPSSTEMPPAGAGVPSAPTVPGSSTPTIPSTVPNTK